MHDAASCDLAAAKVSASKRGPNPPSAYQAIGDDFQLKTAYDQLKAWNIFARPAGVGAPPAQYEAKTAGR